MKCYKFRPLADQKDEDRAKEILENECFWCADFFDLNDPMEGAFTISKNQDIQNTISEIYKEKIKYKICSFSGCKEFETPAMWGYYANGFKGLAIEVEIKDSLSKNVTYIKEISEIKDPKNAEELLTRKLDSWIHEDEFRFLKKSDSNYHPIGTITAVYFGEPHNGFYNGDQICGGSESLKEYEQRKERLKQVAQSKGISPHSVEISSCGKVKIIP
jgi:hypothetical protein